MVGVIEVILILVFAFYGFKFLHSMFDISYFGASAIGKEIVGCLIFGIIATTLSACYFIVSAIIIGICSIISFAKGKTGMGVCSIILGIMIVVIGINL